MSVFSRITSAFSGPTSRKTDVLPQLLGSMANGDVSSIDGAMQVAAVNACVKVIAETIGSLPLLTYRRLPTGGKERAETLPLYDLLRFEPNADQTSMEWREQLLAQLLLRGNAYCRIYRDQAGTITELVPLDPDRVTVKLTPGGAIAGYELRGGDTRGTVLVPADVIHFRGLSTSGPLGRSVLADAAVTFGAAASAQQYGKRVLDNDATPSLVLKHPTTLDEEAAKRLRESWQSMFSGPRNAGRTAVLEEGMSIQQLSMSAEDLQFLDTRKLQRQEIAALYRVPPHMIGDLSQSSFSNIEQQSIEFVTHCIRPWAVRFEQALRRRLLTASQKRDYFFELQLDGLMRGDLQSRYTAYSVGRQAGFLSVNDIRNLENMNPIGAGGDHYLEPLNMQAVE